MSESNWLKKEISQFTPNQREAHFVYRSLVSASAGIEFSKAGFVNVEDFDEAIVIRLQKSLDRLKSGEPLQYVVGQTEFFGIPIAINRNVLIPRPETEELVAWVLEINHQKDVRLLDWCTGSGCIALALKKHRPDWEITALDCSELALACANENSKTLQIPVNWKLADLLNWNPNISAEFKEMEEPKVDIIVSNPPYIPRREMESMEERVIYHEPHLALFVPNDDPMLFYRCLANFGCTHLKRNGQLFVEIHENLADEVADLFLRFGYSDIEVKADMQEKQRMIRAINGQPNESRNRNSRTPPKNP